ncbi:MAG: single-stranded DNA-binding protein [Lachnospiraceae bacterium]|nr:single-stranded DNA-binding protein [Lachnospiraceae bacterium]
MELNVDKQCVDVAVHTNEVKLIGKLVKDKWGRLYNKLNGYITTHLEVKRQSETVDTIPLKISNKVIDVDTLKSLENTDIYIEGKVISFDRLINDKHKLIIMIGVDKITDEIPDNLTTNNFVKLEGIISKVPTFRKTPLNRYITELNLETNISEKYSSRIPCICWSHLAVKAAEFEVDTVITVIGRFQSRDYTKKLSDGSVISKTTYEISIQTIDGVDTK